MPPPCRPRSGGFVKAAGYAAAVEGQDPYVITPASLEAHVDRAAALSFLAVTPQWLRGRILM